MIEIKLQISEDQFDELTVKRLREFRAYHNKYAAGSEVPHISYDIVKENKHRKRIRKSIDMLLGYMEG